MLSTRPAVRQDIGRITEIYNEAILTTDATFDVEPRTESEQLAWFKGHGPRNPVLVAELDGAVIGWASLSEWSARQAYAGTCEVSVYVQEAFRGRGAGKLLLDAVMRAGECVGLHTVIARIVTGNDISIRLHESAGFEHIGTMREVGRKMGRLLDVRLMQRIYDR